MHAALPLGLGPEALRRRLQDLRPRLLVAADAYFYRGQPVRVREVVEAAIQGLDLKVLWHVRGSPEFLERLYEARPAEPEPVPAAHPLFLLPTSGSTGKPKGVVHGHGGTWWGSPGPSDTSLT